MLQQHLILALLWILFGVLHSVLAGTGLKQQFATAFPKAAKHYRLLYTIIAFITFAIVISYAVQIQSSFLFTSKVFSKAAGFIICGSGLVIMAICIKKYFLSLSGLKSLFQQQPVHTLMINGIHRYVRHPLYLGTFLAIWGAFLIYPLFSLFVSNFFITSYTLIGITFEERKLLIEFGNDYKAYQQTVPKLLPLIRQKR